MPEASKQLENQTPLAGYDRQWKTVRLHEPPHGEICSLSILGGASAEFSKIFEKTFNCAVPQPNTVVSFDGGKAFWSAPDQFFVCTDRVDPFYDKALSEIFGDKAAVTLQSDAWVRTAIVGDGAISVLERLIALDLHEASFPAGRAARTLMGHLNVFILKVSNQKEFELWCARSFAESFIHELSATAENIEGG